MLVYEWSQDPAAVPMLATLTLSAPQLVGTCTAPAACPVTLGFTTPWGTLTSWYPTTILTYDLVAQPDDLLAGFVRLNWANMQLSFSGTNESWQMTLNDYGPIPGFFYDPAAPSASAAEPSTALLLAAAIAVATLARRLLRPA